ncbi:MAG: hypothetical protein J5585_08395 [Clostridia bacterium]|nr:hypothetical protein [Clostridia bacterium]
MNKVRYILDLNNVLPSPAVRGQVHAQVAKVIAAAEESKKPKKAKKAKNKKPNDPKSKRRVLTVIAVIAAAAAVGAVVFAVVRRIRETPRHSGDDSSTTTSAENGTTSATAPGTEADPVRLDAYPVTPLYAGDKDYSDLLAAIKYTLLGSDGIVLMNEAGKDRLALGYADDTNASVSRIVRGIYAASDYGDCLIESYEGLVSTTGDRKILLDYQKGFDPVIVAAKRSGTFEYLIVVDVDREADGNFSTHFSSKAGRFIDGVYMFYPDVLEHENAFIYKIRFECGHPVIYDKAQMYLGNTVKYKEDRIAIRESDFFSASENDMRAVVNYSEVLPQQCPYTFALPGTYDGLDLPENTVDPGITTQVSRSEICQIINNSSSAQWFIPLDAYTEDGIRYLIGIRIDYSEGNYWSPETGDVVRREFITNTGGKVKLYYSPSTSDRPYLCDDFSKAVRMIDTYTVKDGTVLPGKQTSLSSTFKAMQERIGATPGPKYTGTMPVFKTADRTGLTAFAAELLQQCKDPGVSGKTGLFEQLGLTVAAPVTTGTEDKPLSDLSSPDIIIAFSGDYILSSVEMNVYSVTQTIVDGDGATAYVYGVRGYVIRAGQSVTEGLTFTYDGYLNGIYWNGGRVRGSCTAGDGFRIIADSDGNALRVIDSSFEYAK